MTDDIYRWLAMGDGREIERPSDCSRLGYNAPAYIVRDSGIDLEYPIYQDSVEAVETFVKVIENAYQRGYRAGRMEER